MKNLDDRRIIHYHLTDNSLLKFFIEEGKKICFIVMFFLNIFYFVFFIIFY